MSDPWNITTGMAIGHKKKREKGDKTGEYQECGQFAKWGGPLRADSMPADVFCRGSAAINYSILGTYNWVQGELQ